MNPSRIQAVFAVLLSLISTATVWGDEQAANLPQLQVVLLTPKDVDPPAEVNRRITQIANYTEHFFNAWLQRWGYEPGNKKLFTREPGGNVRVLVVRGEQPLASGDYEKPEIHDVASETAVKQYQIPRLRHVWWVFIYLGEPPLRGDAFYGQGNFQTGGWAVANYSSEPGIIDLNEEMAAGFNRVFRLKAAIHELGHAFGLPHLGPRPNNPLGNSLMGPTNDVYFRQTGSQDRRVYLPQACAAMLWKHPIFSGTTKDRGLMPSVELQDYRAEFKPEAKSILVRGRLKSNYPAHSVVVMNDADGKIGPYWIRGYASRLAGDGSFQVSVDEPPASGGQFKILFCFANGAVTGDGKAHGESSAILKPYRYSAGEYHFEELDKPPRE